MPRSTSDPHHFSASIVIAVNGEGNGSACSNSRSSGGSDGLGASAPVGAGALVVTVENGTPAQGAGIQQGTRSSASTVVPSPLPEALTRMVQAERPGDQVEVGWVDIDGRLPRGDRHPYRRDPPIET